MAASSSSTTSTRFLPPSSGEERDGGGKGGNGGGISGTSLTIHSSSNTGDNNERTRSFSTTGSGTSGTGTGSSAKDYAGLDFKIIWDCKSVPQVKTLHLVAPTIQEKAAWISDISQVRCISNYFLLITFPLWE